MEIQRESGHTQFVFPSMAEFCAYLTGLVCLYGAFALLTADHVGGGLYAIGAAIVVVGLVFAERMGVPADSKDGETGS